MITKVQLKGWRSHLDSTLEFAEGTNALIGVMGSGKSSVLDAISFALFGTFPALQARKLVLEDVIMKRPQKQAHASVALEFESGGSTYAIKRVIERGGRTAEIRKDGKLMDVGVTKVNDVVERTLHTDYDLFSRAVYAEQNGLDYFLTIPKGQRMKRIDALLRIDRFEAARTTCASVMTRIRDRIRDKGALVREMESGDELKRLSAVEREMQDLEKKRREMKAHETELSSSVTRAEEELKSVRRRELETRSIEVERGILHSTIKTLEEEMSGEALSVKDLQKQMDELVEEIDRTNALTKDLDKKLRDADTIKQRLAFATEEAQKQIARLESIGAVCPLCEQPMDESHRKRHVKDKKAHLEAVLRDALEAEDRVKTVSADVESKENVMEGLIKKRSDLENALFHAFEREKKQLKLQETKAKLVQAEIKLVSMKGVVSERAMDELEKTLRAASSALAELRAESRASENTFRERANEQQRLLERKTLFERHHEQIKKMEALAEDLQKFRSALEETQTALRREFVTSVNVTMSSLWETLYPYEDYADVRLGVGDDYTLEIRESGGAWVTVEGVASGGERTTALLALRMAFALVLAPNLRWLVLDEPTHNLDANAVEQLAEVLRDHIGEYVDQVFLITHDEKLEDAVTGYLYRLEREREKNEPTRVVCVMSPKEMQA